MEFLNKLSSWFILSLQEVSSISFPISYIVYIRILNSIRFISFLSMSLIFSIYWTILIAFIIKSYFLINQYIYYPPLWLSDRPLPLPLLLAPNQSLLLASSFLFDYLDWLRRSVFSNSSLTEATLSNHSLF